MIYMEPLQLGPEPLVTSWMENQLPDIITPDQRKMIQVLPNSLVTSVFTALVKDGILYRIFFAYCRCFLTGYCHHV